MVACRVVFPQLCLALVLPLSLFYSDAKFVLRAGDDHKKGFKQAIALLTLCYLTENYVMFGRFE